jgi:hypothetical protein
MFHNREEVYLKLVFHNQEEAYLIQMKLIHILLLSLNSLIIHKLRMRRLDKMLKILQKTLLKIWQKT